MPLPKPPHPKGRGLKKDSWVTRFSHGSRRQGEEAKKTILSELKLETKL
jgi:hypothetical protein